MENQEIISEMLNEANFAVKELEGRVYFEALPLLDASFSKDRPVIQTPQSVLGVRG
jgi:hypothetical protein